ncbi:phosphonate ABC transporter ATP-binding protein [Roseateles oligotrophus]|uniref:ATP-binding cassette domain-containing protein n=1 Tax=Roseateles oligotrophus TaxID=1769250 RepID=A0ABT2YHC7_9BURK|nr:ATP-binding cassette domain-containing protein [Roseateles oligotrophus]MCV2369370.1 ATP-binding cassette domain-containing protein [Roseateles oligotrophus]
MNQTSMSRAPDIEIRDLRCEFQGRLTLALPRLTIESGEHITLIGPNGAGKSTLLRCLAGFAATAGGHLSVLGRPLHKIEHRALRSLRSEVGVVLQGLHLVQRLSALENVLIGALGRLNGAEAWRSWARIYSPRERAAAFAALHQVGLAGREQERADKLSGGERQKVAIARMLMQRPRLILADEPTAALDPAAALEICELLARAAKDLNATLISVVHNTALLPLLGERVIGLRQAGLAFDLPVEAVGEPELQTLYRNDSVQHIDPGAEPMGAEWARPVAIHTSAV